MATQQPEDLVSGDAANSSSTTPAVTQTSMGPVYDETRPASDGAPSSTVGDAAYTSEEHLPEDEPIDENAYNEWDEGGPSQCGYNESFHNVLMKVGKSVHNVVGDPSPGVEKGMKTVGNWFQEASYAVRDFCRGNKQELGDDASETLSTMKEDALAAVNDIMGKNSNSEKMDAQTMNDAISNPSTPYTAQTN